MKAVIGRRPSLLAPARYENKFVVGGEWIPDPLARENVWNHHGTLNSVLEVRA
ncbi:MAG TPA: glycogen-binding domain-containing protein [Verrucomicrobiae bacterium]|nr:glycogen-binding domain-containing protein [Verrucomicrobiae bacterium]